MKFGLKMNKKAKTILLIPVVAFVVISILFFAFFSDNVSASSLKVKLNDFFNKPNISSVEYNYTPPNITNPEVIYGLNWQERRNEDGTYTRQIYQNPVFFFDVLNFTEDGEDFLVEWSGNKLKIKLNVVEKNKEKNKEKKNYKDYLESSNNKIYKIKEKHENEDNPHYEFYWIIESSKGEKLNIDYFTIEIENLTAMDYYYEGNTIILPGNLILDLQDLIDLNYTLEKNKSEIKIKSDSFETSSLIDLDPAWTFRYESSQDTHIRSGAPTTNYATSTTVSFSDSAYRGLISFDISEIPLNSTIVDAQIYVYMSGGSSSDSKAVYPLNESWVEAQAIWTNRSLNTPWTVVGGSYNTSLPSDNFTTSSGWDSWNVTTTLKSRYPNGTSKYVYGWAVVSSDGTTQSFRSKEYTGTNTDPYINITWEPPLPTLTMEPTNGTKTTYDFMYLNCSASFTNIDNYANITSLLMEVWKCNDSGGVDCYGAETFWDIYGESFTPAGPTRAFDDYFLTSDLEDSWYTYYCLGDMEYETGWSTGSVYLGGDEKIYTFLVDSTGPTHTFVSPSPTDGGYSTGTVIINTSVTDRFSDISACNLSFSNISGVSTNITNLTASMWNISEPTYGNNNPTGMASNGTFFWVADFYWNRIFKYFMNGTWTGSYFITNVSGGDGNPFGGGGDMPYGVATNTTFLFVLNHWEDNIDRYYPNGTYTGVSWSPYLAPYGTGNNNPAGLTTNGTFFWVGDWAINKIFKYFMNGTYTGNSWNVTGTHREGYSQYYDIATNNTFIWVSDVERREVSKYFANGTWTGETWSTVPSGNVGPSAIHVNNTFIWITDVYEEKMYKYSMNYSTTTLSYQMTKTGSGNESFCSYTLPTLTNGYRYHADILANDSLGNINITHGTSGIGFTYDSSAPLLKIVSPTNFSNYSTATVSVNYTVSDALSGLSMCWWSKDFGATNTTLTCGNNISSTFSEGLNTVIVWANDSANALNKSNVTFRVDTIAPNLSIKYPSNNSLIKDEYDLSIALNLTAIDNGTGVISIYKYRFNNGANVFFTPNTTLVPSIGQNNITITVNDSVNNTAVSFIKFNMTFSPRINQTNISNYTMSYLRNGVTSSLIGYWNFDRNWSVQTDSSSSGINITPSSPNTMYNLSGKIGGGYSLDGNDDYLTSATNFKLNTTRSFAVSMWINPSSVNCDANNNWRSLIRVSSSLASATSGWDVVWEEGGYPQFDLGNGSSTHRLSNSGSPTPVGTWAHYIFMYDYNGDTTSIYKDGVWQANKTIVGKLSYGTNNLLNIGYGSLTGCSAGSGYMNGTYDEIMYFNRTLTSTEILYLFQETNPTFQYPNVTITVNVTDEDTAAGSLYYKWFVDGVSVLAGFAQTVFNTLLTSSNQEVKVVVNDSQNYSTTQKFNVTILDSDSMAISGCMDLDIANMEYLLTSDITNAASTCFDVGANYVTLDCQNHIVDGSDLMLSYGVDNHLSDKINLTIKNCVFTDWDVGIWGEGDNLNLYNVNVSSSKGGSGYTGNGLKLRGDNLNLTNVKVTSNGAGGTEDGIYLDDVYDSYFYNVESGNNTQYGIILIDSARNTFQKINASYNSQHGIALTASVLNSDDNYFKDINVSKNYVGFAVVDYANNLTIVNLTAMNNTYVGMFIDGVDDLVIKNSTLFKNYAAGLYLENSTRFLLENVNSYSNNYEGLWLVGTNTSNFTNVSSHNNFNNGLFLVSSSNNTFTNLSIIDNLDGLWLENATWAYSGKLTSSNNYFINSTISGNDHGIYIKEGTNNTFTNSTIKNSTTYGVQLVNARLNKFYNNLFNNTAYYVPANSSNTWNITVTSGVRRYSEGISIGGNYWTNSTSNGPSDTCADSNTDGFCDLYYNVSAGSLSASCLSGNCDYLAYSDEYYLDTTPPSFTTIPANSSLWYGNQSLSVTFVATDDAAIDEYAVNDTRFSISSGGLLTNATPLAVATYTLNVSVNDTAGYKAWTFYKVLVSKSNYACDVIFNTSSPLTFPTTFRVYTNCGPSYTLYRNGTSISNNSEQRNGAGYYNFTVRRSDTVNYTNFFDDEFFTINKNSENCKVLYSKTSPLEYPNPFYVWANCTSGFTLRRNGSVISNYSEQALFAGAYNFSMQRIDTANYTYTYNQSEFRINDTTAPTYSDYGVNETLVGRLAKFYISAADTHLLKDGGGYIFSTNNSGSWVNDTAVAFSTGGRYRPTSANYYFTGPLGGLYGDLEKAYDNDYLDTSTYAYVTGNLSVALNGNHVNYTFQLGSEETANVSMTYTLDHLAGTLSFVIYAINYSNYSASDIFINDATEILTFKNSVFNLSKAKGTISSTGEVKIIFSAYGGNENYAEQINISDIFIYAPAEADIETTKTLTTTVGTHVGYRWFFNDTLKNKASTPIYVLTTTTQSTSTNPTNPISVSSSSNTDLSFKRNNTQIIDETDLIKTFRKFIRNEELPIDETDIISQRDFLKRISNVPLTFSNIIRTSRYFFRNSTQQIQVCTYDFNETNLISYWSMESYNSTGLFDTSLSNHFATFSGGIGLSNLSEGAIASAFEFDGKNSRNMINTVSLDVPTEGTMSFWVKGKINTTYQRPENIYPIGWQGRLSILGPSVGTSERSGIITSNGTERYYNWENQGFYVGEWIHYAVTWNTTHVSLYKNGVMVGAPKPHVGEFSTIPNSIFSIGAGWSSTYGTHNGGIDEVMIFDSSLSATDIAEIYNHSNRECSVVANRNFLIKTYQPITEVDLIKTIVKFLRISNQLIDESDSVSYTDKFIYSVNIAQGTSISNIIKTSRYFFRNTNQVIDETNSIRDLIKFIRSSNQLIDETDSVSYSDLYFYSVSVSQYVDLTDIIKITRYIFKKSNQAIDETDSIRTLRVVPVNSSQKITYSDAIRIFRNLFRNPSQEIIYEEDPYMHVTGIWIVSFLDKLTFSDISDIFLDISKDLNQEINEEDSISAIRNVPRIATAPFDFFNIISYLRRVPVNSSQQITFCEYPFNTTGLVSLWNMDENSTSQVDEFGGNNGIVYNALFEEEGRYGGSYHFDGSGDFINVTNSTDFNLTEAVSYSIWVKMDKQYAFDRIMVKSHTAAVYPYTIFGITMTGGTYHPTEIKGNARLELTQGGKQHVIHTTSLVPLGEWVHIVATYNGSVPKMYYNGILETENQEVWQYSGTGTTGVYVNMSGPLDFNDMPVIIGWDGLTTTANFWNGSLDEAMIFNRELSEEEVWEIYNLQSNQRECVVTEKQSIYRDSDNIIEYEDWLDILREFFRNSNQPITEVDSVKRNISLTRLISVPVGVSDILADEFGSLFIKLYQGITQGNIVKTSRYFFRDSNQPITTLDSARRGGDFFISLFDKIEISDLVNSLRYFFRDSNQEITESDSILIFRAFFRNSNEQITQDNLISTNRTSIRSLYEPLTEGDLVSTFRAFFRKSNQPLTTGESLIKRLTFTRLINVNLEISDAAQAILNVQGTIASGLPLNNTYWQSPVNFSANLTDFSGLNRSILYIMNNSDNTLLTNVVEYLSGEDSLVESWLVTLVDGVYNWWISFFDIYETETVGENYTIEVDSTIPDVHILRPLGGDNYNYQNLILLNFTVNDTNLDSCWYNLNNGDNTTINCSEEYFFNSTEGPQTLYLFANDSASGQGIDYVSFEVNIAPPSLSLSHPTDGEWLNYTNDIQFNFTASDSTLDTCQLWGNWTGSWALNQSNTSSYEMNGTVSTFYVTLQEGFYEYNIRCNDSSNNEIWNGINISFGVDTTTPAFTTIPSNASLWYGNQSLSVDFDATDNLQFGYFSINDTRFSITNPGGVLTNATPIAVGSYAINITINDSTNNLNWTIFSFEINQSNNGCNVLFNETSPLNYPSKFKVYTDCGSAYTLYRNGSTITNNSEQNNGIGYYNFTVKRTDTENFTNTFDDEFFTINPSQEVCQVLFNETSPLGYPNKFIVWANCTSAFTLYINNTLISNNSEQDLAVGAYNFSMQRTDNINYTFNYNETEFRIIDVVSPTSNLLLPENNTYFTDLFQNFTANFSDDVGLRNVTLYVYNSTGIYNSTLTEFDLGTLSIEIGANVSLVDGRYNWSYLVFDYGGNNYSTENNTVIIDTTSPSLTYGTGTEVNGSSFNRDFIYVNVSAVEENKENITFTLAKDGVILNETTTDPILDINWTGLSDGLYLYNVTMVDKVNLSSSLGDYYIYLDSVTPELILNGPEPINYANTSIELNITVIDYLSGIDYCWYNVYFTENDTYLLTNQFIPNCSNNTPVTSSFSVPTGDNDISITVYVNDSANNTDNLGVTIGIRTESPAIVLNYPTANKYFNTTSDILFNFTATDLKDGVNAIDYCALWTNTTGTWELNQTTWIASSGVNYNWATVDISEGYFKWNVFCNDAYNNSEWAASNYTFTTDITAPILNITTPLNGSSVSSTTVIFNYTLIETNVYTCEFNVLNSLGVWEYSPNQTLTCSNGSRAISVPVGTHTLYIWSTDRAGNTNYTSSTFTVSSTSGGGGGGGAEPIEIIKEVPSNKTFCGDGICQTEGNDLGIREDFFSCQQDCPGFNIDSAIFYCFDSDPNTICIWDSVKYQYIGLFLGIVLAILLFSTVEDKKTKKQVSLIRYWIIVAKRDKDKGKKKKRKDKNMKPREYRRI